MALVRSGQPWWAPAIPMAAATALILGTVACAARSTEVDWPDVPTPRPVAEDRSEPLNAAEAEAAEAILALVHEFREVEVASYADPQAPHHASRELAGYLADPLLMYTVSELSALQQDGIVFEGRPRWQPTVSEVRLDETPPVATVRDCVDATDWRPVYRATGDPILTDGPDRYVAWLQAKWYPDHGWLIYQVGLEDVPC